MGKIAALIKAEWRSISRDLLLLITVVVPLLVALVIRIVVPIVTELLQEQGIDLTLHYVFIAGVALMMTPMMLGAMAGLQILDDRDERVLSYISVTPLTREGYLLWKLLTPVIIGCVQTPLALILMDIIPVKLGVVLPVTLLAALGAPIYALIMPAFAANKVEGLAISKASGIIMLAPFAGYLLPWPWAILAATMPPFWPVLAFVAGYSGEWTFWPYILGGVAVHLVWIHVLQRRFGNRAD